MKLTEILYSVLNENVAEFVKKYRKATTPYDFQQLLQFDDLKYEVSKILNDPSYEKMQNDAVRKLLINTDLGKKVQSIINSHTDEKAEISKKFAKEYPEIQNLLGMQGSPLTIHKVRRKKNGRYILSDKYYDHDDVTITPEQLEIVKEIIKANRKFNS